MNKKFPKLMIDTKPQTQILKRASKNIPPKIYIYAYDILTSEDQRENL